jgi:hypothetical protein
MRHEAIYKVHPNVVRVDDSLGAFDADGNAVAIDEAAVAAEAVRLQAAFDAKDYQRKRMREYPPVTDYLDGIVKNDQAQIQAYIDACLAVKAKYPKP